MKCKDGIQCVDKWKVCDGGPAQCNDGSDQTTEFCRGEVDFSIGTF